MAIAGVKVAVGQLVDGLILAYSLVVMATVIPGFGTISTIIVVPYFLLVPGYTVAVLLRSTATITEGLFYSVAWSIAILASLYSVRTIAAGFQYIPISIVVPVLTIVLMGYGRFRR